MSEYLDRTIVKTILAWLFGTIAMIWEVIKAAWHGCIAELEFHVASNEAIH